MNHTFWSQLLDAGYYFSRPLSLFFFSLSDSFILYQSTEKSIPSPLLSPTNQCMIVNKNWGKTPSQERDPLKSGVFVLIILNYTRLMWQYKWCPSVPFFLVHQQLFYVPIISFWDLEVSITFLTLLYSMLNTWMLQRACVWDAARLKK